MFFETIAKFDTFQFICGTPTAAAQYPFLILFRKGAKGTYIARYYTTHLAEKIAYIAIMASMPAAIPAILRLRGFASL